MKRFFCTLILSAATIYAAYSQTVLSSKSNAFKYGDTHKFNIMTNAEEGPAGKHVVWDFSGLKTTDKTLVSSMYHSSVTDYSALAPHANLILEEYGNMFFFKVDENGMQLCGSKACEMVTSYDKPITKLNFPFKYGDNCSGIFSGSKSYQNTKLPVSGTYNVVADGIGTILLPNNISIDNALRVKETLTYNNSDIKNITYRWYSKDIRYPILTITTQVNADKKTIIQTAMYAQTMQTKSGQITSSIEDAKNADDLTIYPVPFENQINITYKLDITSKVAIEAFDITGKQILTIQNATEQTAGNHTCTYSTTNNELPVGVYYIKITIGENAIIRKVVKI